MQNSNGVLSVTAYMENPNSISSFANKVLGSLPVIGLVARILSDEGGVGDDIIDFAEFRRRVGKKCTITDSRAFYEFQDRRGRAGDPLYVLLCCWLAAVGASYVLVTHAHTPTPPSYVSLRAQRVFYINSTMLL